MTQLIRNTLLALLIAAAPVPILAQDDAPDAEAFQTPEAMNGMMGMGGTNGMMNGHMMHNGTMPMMNMMLRCASMMEGMHPSGAVQGDMSHHMGSDSMMNGSMSLAEGVSYDAATAEALARAYLHAQNPESVQETAILGATLDAGRYTVTYRLGDTEGAVLVDATTGIVLPKDTR